MAIRFVLSFLRPILRRLRFSTMTWPGWAGCVPRRTIRREVISEKIKLLHLVPALVFREVAINFDHARILVADPIFNFPFAGTLHECLADEEMAERV